MLAFKRSPDELLLALPAELLPTTLKRLSMFVLRAKCKLTDASAELALWGLAGDSARRLLGADAPADIWGVTPVGNALVLRLPDALVDGHRLPRYALLQEAAAAAPALPALTADSWQWLEVQAGLAWVRTATVEQFVPQMINLELLGGVNFQKGCYPGQEIVARSQYLGKLKRRMFLGTTRGAVPLPGSDVIAGGGTAEPCGQVVLAAPAPDGSVELLFESQTAAAQAGGLSVGGAPLEQLPLPYSIPG
jgi:hypothetical protein